MSVVILYNGKHPVMVADSRCTAGGGQFTDSLRKAFSIRGGLLGVIGSASAITSVRKAVWSEPDISKTQWPKLSYTALYLDKRGKLFEIDNGQVISHDKVLIMAVGGGSDLALGASESWMTINKISKRNCLPPEKSLLMLRHSMKCVFKHNAMCGGRIQVKHLEVA